MTLYLFHDNGEGKAPDYLGQYTSMKSVNVRIKKDLLSLRNEFPNRKWSRRDYLVARRVK